MAHPRVFNPQSPMAPNPEHPKAKLEAKDLHGECEACDGNNWVVTDEQILDAMAFLFDRLKLVTEPSGATATAALLAGHVEKAGTIAALISGGNVGLARCAELMSRPRGSAR